ncbi:hypothetical protein ACFLTS_00295 [Chloroflexota bacterium]
MDRGKALCDELKKANIHHIVWLTNSETHFMNNAILADPDLKVIKVCREGEAVAICVGLHLGGERGALLVENQGIFECGNVLKWAIGLKTPMLLMIGYLGYRFLQDTPQGKMWGADREYTEPFLDAFEIKHYLVNSDEDAKKLVPATEEAWRSGKPVALLITSTDEYAAGT